MKKLIWCLPVLFLAFTVNVDGLSKKERKFAISYLEETRNDLTNTIKGLSEAQFNFKPADNRWSVKECLQHIATTEKALWKWSDSIINAPANPEKRADVKTSDQDIINGLTNRTQKFQAPAEMRPENSPFSTALDAFNGFKAARESVIKYVKKTNVDLRSHVTQGPMGAIDAYQMILFIGAHSNRHTQQIAEIMADPNFPKN